jgi:hypothetical protein
MNAMQTVVTCSRPDGSSVSLPMLGPRGRALIQNGWHIEACDDGNVYSLRLTDPRNDTVGYAAQGPTWASAWNQLEYTIACLGKKGS